MNSHYIPIALICGCAAFGVAAARPTVGAGRWASQPAPQGTPTANWSATAQTVLDISPGNWTPSSPTVIFAGGAGGEIEPYRCYAETWQAQGIRTVIPLMAGGITFEQRRSRWRQLNTIYEALLRQPAGNWKRPPVRREKLVIAGHSFGAYVALLAAGADSRLGQEQAGNCAADGRCAALSAAGYLILSGQPAQNARANPPFWFRPDAFRALAPGRLVIYGSKDFVPTDPCMTETVVDSPSCRGDAHTAQPAASNRHSQLKVIEGFSHSDFGCTGVRKEHAESLTNLQREIGEWIVQITNRAPERQR